MRICWHGHSCFEISNNETIVIDPHDGRSIGLRKPEASADVVLISHDHYDHNAARVVSKRNAKILTEPKSYRNKRVQIKGFSSFHDEMEGAKRGLNLMFKVSTEGINLLHCGDLGHVPDPKLAEKIGEVDIIFIPIGGVFTIGASTAWEVIRALKPKVAIPMHYNVTGLSMPLDGPEKFLKYAPDKINRVGNEIDFTKEDLPKDFEIWLFSI